MRINQTLKTYLAAILRGTDGNDDIEGTAGSDTINGLKGNDFLKGLAGDDFLNGDDGNDTLKGGEGSDKLIGGDGNDFLFGSNGINYAQTLALGYSDEFNGGKGLNTYVDYEISDDTYYANNDGFGNNKNYFLDWGGSDSYIVHNGDAEIYERGAGTDEITLEPGNSINENRNIHFFSKSIAGDAVSSGEKTIINFNSQTDKILIHTNNQSGLEINLLPSNNDGTYYEVIDNEGLHLILYFRGVKLDNSPIQIASTTQTQAVMGLENKLLSALQDADTIEPPAPEFSDPGRVSQSRM